VVLYCLSWADKEMKRDKKNTDKKKNFIVGN
jgi:hypothetical protein